MALKEFKAKLESDEAFRAKFVDVKTPEELIARAKTEGYDLEQLSENELDAVAGGIDWGGLWNSIKSALTSGTPENKLVTKVVTDTVEKIPGNAPPLPEVTPTSGEYDPSVDAPYQIAQSLCKGGVVYF